MKKTKYLLLLLIIPILSGCYNYRELNKLAIITAISIDYEDDEFKIVNQVINPIKEQDAASSGEPTFVNFKCEAPSLQEAFNLVIVDSPRQLYASQLQILILSEEVASNHLEEVLDFFIRDPEIRAEFKIIIAQNKDDLEGVSLQTVLDNLSSSNILDSLELQRKKEGLTLDLTLNELANMYLDPYEEIALPSMIVEGDISDGESRENVTNTEAKATTKISTTAIFKGKKLLGYLDKDESITVSLIKGQLNNTIVNMDYKDGYIVFEPNRVKVKLDADPKKNTVTLNIEGFSRLDELAADIDIKSSQEVKKLEKEFNKFFEDKIMENFQSIREKYNSDIFGFRNLYYKKDDKYFKENCSNWYQEIFPNLKLKVKSNIKLYEKGHSLGGIEYERKN